MMSIEEKEHTFGEKLRRRSGLQHFVSLLFCLFLWGGGQCASNAAAATLTVAAAADVRPAFDEIGRLFEQRTGHRVIFSYGSSGLLAKQVEQGAPYDLFAAANEKYLDDLLAKKAIRRGSKVLYATGQITLWMRKDSPAKPLKLKDLLNSRIQRIAIANPEHAPYGEAAREALQHLGLWGKVEPKLVYAENVSQALQFAQSGNADVAIVALSLCFGSGGRYVAIPGELHKPIIQAMGIPASSKNPALARQFQRFVVGQDGRKIMRRYGFLFPGEKAVR